MPNRINGFTLTTSWAADDYVPLDGATNNTRRILASQFWVSPTLSGTITCNPNAPAADSVFVKNSSSTGYSSIVFQDNTGTVKGYVGYGNSGATYYTDKTYLYSTGILVLTSGTNVTLTLDATQNGTFSRNLTINGNAASSSTGSGALVVGGGVGIAGALNVGGAIAGSNLSGTNTGDQNLFGSIVIAGQTTVTPASTTQALTLAAGTNITLTTNNTTKTITIAASGGGAVSSVSGTTNQIAVSTTTGDVVVSLPTNVTIAGSFTDSAGNVRSLPQNSQTSAYSLQASDNGKYINITTGGITVPASVFSAGQAVVIYNASASNQTITQGASVTMYLASTTQTGNRTLASYGVATVLCVGSNTFVITGSGLS